MAKGGIRDRDDGDRPPLAPVGAHPGRRADGARAVEAFLDAPKICGNANTLRAYTGVLDRAAAELGPGRPLAGVADTEIETVLVERWGRRPRRPGTATAPPLDPG